MNRREWLKCMSALALSAAGAPLLAVFDAHAAAQEPAAGPRFFSRSQADMVAAVVDIIIPRTDTPGALDAGVPRFIDQMFKDVYPADEQARYLQALAAFEHAGGHHLDPVTAPAFVLMTKKLAMLGFFMSEPGCTQVLQYVAVPGGYQADVPLSKAGNGRAWAVETVLRL